MHTTATQANPFALLMDPDAVFRTLETSGRLDSLQRRVCRPLDKPLIPRTASDVDDLDEADDVRDSDESANRLF
jgi:hypothetical protein